MFSTVLFKCKLKSCRVLGLEKTEDEEIYCFSAHFKFVLNIFSIHSNAAVWYEFFLFSKPFFLNNSEAPKTKPQNMAMAK